MKKYLIPILLFPLIALGATRRDAGFFVTGDYGGEPIYAAEQNNQTADWILFTSNNLPVFELPASGVVPVAYGGTGTNSLGQFVQYTYNQTYVTNALGDTNHIYALGFGMNTGSTNVNVTYTLISPNFWKSTNGTAIYSNATLNAYAISNAFGDLLYTNSNVNGATNAGWAVGIGSSPASGITNQDQIVISYNPTLSSAIISANIATNTANFTTVTNNLVANAFTLLRGQRSTVTISLANSGAGAGIIYSNAATGKQHTYLMSPGAGTMTNTFTIRCQPNSMVAPTNAAIILNTTEIDYE